MWLAVDIDGVLGDHVLHLIEYLKDKGVLDSGFTKDNIDRWDSLIGGKGFKEVFEAHLFDREFVLGIPVIEGAVEAIRRLRGVYKVLIVTARPRYAYGSTMEWLKRNGFEFDRFEIDVGDERVNLGVDILIDDNPYTILDFVRSGGLGIIFTQPWNKSLEYNPNDMVGRLVRFDKWGDIVDYLLNLRGF